MKTILVAGLGNPGEKYAPTRHNAGFRLADYFQEENRENFSDWELKKKINSETSAGKFGGRKIILLKPQTFMNLSGSAVAAAKKYYKIKLENIFVVHDEIDLPLGDFRFSRDSSSAGHKGVQNIIDELGTKNFARLRIGVDNRPALREGRDKLVPTEKYVLGKFTGAELEVLKKVLGEAANELLEKVIK